MNIAAVQTIVFMIFWLMVMLGLVWPVLWLILAIFACVVTTIIGIWAIAIFFQL